MRDKELTRMKPYIQNIHGNSYASHVSRASLDVLDRFFNMIFDVTIKNRLYIRSPFAQQTPGTKDDRIGSILPLCPDKQ